MPGTCLLDQLAVAVSGMARQELIRRIKNFKGPFRLDFTDDYLAQASDDRLRHILLAAMMEARAGS